jgi:hypothetical protein
VKILIMNFFVLYPIVLMSEVTAANRPQEAPPLPMAYPFPESKFFVRECYGKYYDVIIKLLGMDPVTVLPNEPRPKFSEVYDYITVTGSPGIGKSVFYLYFVEKYRKENPEKTIVTAAFAQRYLTSGMVLYPDSDNMESERFYLRIPSIENAIYLYDGAPEAEPSRKKMVCFSSPNEAWLNYMRKNIKHVKLIMPPWTLNELLEAAQALWKTPSQASPTLTPEEIESRF